MFLFDEMITRENSTLGQLKKLHVPERSELWIINQKKVLTFVECMKLR